MNKVTLIGNLTKDVELSTTTSGVNVAKFTIAVQRKYTNENGEREADFINCVAWRALADACHKYLHKGSKVAVVGAIQNRTYEAQDGAKKYITEIVADEIGFLSPKQTENNAEVKQDLIPIEDDGLPF